MPSLLQQLLAFGTFQGFLLSALLLLTPNISYASRILGIWCSLLALLLLGVLVQQSGEVEPYNILLVTTSFLPASYGALLYLYCRHSVLDDRFRTKDLLHLAPFLSCYVLNADILFSADSFDQVFVQGIEPVSIRFTLAKIIMYGQAYIYLGYTAYYLFRYQKQAQNNYASFNPDIFDWLWIVQGFNLIIWSSKTALLVVSDNFVLLIAGDLLIVVLIYGIGLAQWRNPQLFKISDPAQGDPLTSHNDMDSKAASTLDESTRVSLLDTVIQYMKTQQAFLDSSLSLRGLSEAVGISTHHLSEVLNQEEGQNFYNFVNNFRIEFVCERLKMDKDIKLLDLGLNAGFSSKSTFNSVFKKHTGLTPSQYRKNSTE